MYRLKIRTEPEQCTPKTSGQMAFSLVELLVVIAVIAVLAAVLAPAISGARARARSVECVSNLRQIGIGVISYANEHNGVFPPVYDRDAVKTSWMTKTLPYLNMGDKEMGTSPLPRTAGVFVCPDIPDAKRDARAASYAFTRLIDKEKSVKYNWNYRALNTSPSNTFLVVEIEGGHDTSSELEGRSNSVVRRHPGDTANYLFVDGHVESLSGWIPPADVRWIQK